MDYRRYEGETDEALIYRICRDKPAIGSWRDVADVLNQLLGTNYGESAFRKKYTAFEKMYEANSLQFANTESQIQDLENQIRELKKERSKLQTEKIEYNRWLREEARDELIIERIEDAIKSIEPLSHPQRIASQRGHREYVLLFGDEHYGAEFSIKGLMGETINEYSPEIFEERMNNMFQQVVALVQEKGITRLHILNLGDYSDGILRVGQLTKLRYGVVDGTINYANFLAEWLNNLSSYVQIEFHMTDGNHSELRLFNQPKGSFKDENMGKIVREFIRIRLSENPNFKIITNDSGMIYDEVAGYTLVGVHGESKNMKDAMDGISRMYGKQVDILCAGHLHHYNAEDVGVSKTVIRVPSIVGIDPFAASILKGCSSAALLLTIEEGKGRIAEDFLILN